MTSTRTRVSPVALLADTFNRVRSGDNRVILTGALPGDAPVDLTWQDVRDAAADAAWSLDVDFAASYCRVSTGRVHLVGRLEEMLSWWDEDFARQHPGTPQQLAVACPTGVRTFWWSADGMTVYEA